MSVGGRRCADLSILVEFGISVDGYRCAVTLRLISLAYNAQIANGPAQFVNSAASLRNGVQAKGKLNSRSYQHLDR